MPLDTYAMQKIMLEIDRGVPASRSEVPPSPEVDAFRREVEAEIAAANDKGHMLEFTAEFEEPAPTR